MWEGELAFLSTLLKSISTSALNLTLTTCMLIQTGVSSPPSTSPACREIASLFYSPPCPSHPTKGPSAAPWWYLVEPFGCGPLLGLPKGALVLQQGRWSFSHAAGVGKGERQEDRDPNPTDNPSSWQPPCPCSMLLDNMESPSPFCLSWCFCSLLLSHPSHSCRWRRTLHCLWYETLGCWVQ